MTTDVHHASEPATGVSAAGYLDPDVATGLPWKDVEVVGTDDPRVAEVALITDDPEGFEVPIVPWPHVGRRPLDPETGTGGGTIEGDFACRWDGNRLLGSNAAVGGEYVLGWSRAPEDDTAPDGPPDQLLLWHINHHPDGGQLFWSPTGEPFVVLAIPPGEDPDLDRALAIRSDGTEGICVRPGVWHDGVFPTTGDGAFRTRQGAVHARVSCILTDEFALLLRIPLGA